MAIVVGEEGMRLCGLLNTARKQGNSNFYFTISFSFISFISFLIIMFCSFCFAAPPAPAAIAGKSICDLVLL